MENRLSKSVQIVHDALVRHGIPCTIREFPASTRTAQEAAAAIGCAVAQIVKSLIFKTETNQPILVLASGVNRVNEQLIEQEIGEKIGKADPDFTRTVTGFAIGGIPPIGHKQPIQTFIDCDLLQLPELWAAAGTPHAVFSLTPVHLQKLTQGKVIVVH